jgi:hypothetical protein
MELVTKFESTPPSAELESRVTLKDVLESAKFDLGVCQTVFTKWAKYRLSERLQTQCKTEMLPVTESHRTSEPIWVSDTGIILDLKNGKSEDLQSLLTLLLGNLYLAIDSSKGMAHSDTLISLDPVSARVIPSGQGVKFSLKQIWTWK